MSSRGRRPWAATTPGAAVLAAALVLGACGKKGDPEPPLLPIPQAATDLTVEQRGDELILRFAYPSTTAAGLPLPPLERVEVYELVRPAVPPPPPAAPAAPEAAEPESAEPESEAGPETAAPGAEVAAPEPESAVGEPEREAAAPELDAPETGPGTVVPEPAPQPPDAEPAAPESEPESEAAAPEPEPAGAGPARDLYAPPRVEPREFVAAAAVVRTLRGEELTGAVYGARLVVTLPLPSPLPEPPQAHVFSVRTVAEGDFVSAFSNLVPIVPRSPPAPPTGLSATPRAEGIEIAWEPGAEAAGLAGFHVYRRLATERGFGSPLRLAGPSATSFLDRDARYGQRYIYAVTAVAQPRPPIESAIAASREVDYRDVFAPPAPTGLVALADQGAIRLVWDESRAPDLAGYRISRRSGDASWEPLTPEPVTGVESIDRAVEPGRTYRYRVTAVDALGNESDPAEAEALAR